MPYLRLPWWLSCKESTWMQETQDTQVWSLGQEDPLEVEMATNSSILAWKIPWTEDPDRLQSIESLRIGHDWSDGAHRQGHILMATRGSGSGAGIHRDAPKHSTIRQAAAPQQRIICPKCPWYSGWETLLYYTTLLFKILYRWAAREAPCSCLLGFKS